MLRRIDNGKVKGNLGGKKHYIDKLVLFNANKYFFRTFNDQVIFTEIALSIINKTNIVGEIKDYMVNILSAISSLKTLYLHDFPDYATHYDREAYIEQIKRVRTSLYNEVVLDNPLVEIYDMAEITMEQFNLFTKDESFKEKMERTQRGEAKPEPDTVSYAIDGESIAITFPEAMGTKYYNHLCGIIENKTGDFYTDLFSELVTQFASLKTSLNCTNYEAQSITEEYVNVEVANAFNYLVQAIVYLRNSSSFRSNELFGFDLIEVDMKMDMARIMLDKAVDYENRCAAEDLSAN